MIEVIPEVRAVVCYASIIVATVVIVSNGVIMINILYWRALREKHTYKLIACHCFGYVIFGLGIWSKDLFNLYMFYNSTKKFTQFACRMYCLTFMFGFVSIVDFYLLEAIDRCIAVISPRFYLCTNRWWWLFIQLTIAILHSSLFMYYALSLTSNRPISTCTMMNAVEENPSMPLLPGFVLIIFLTMLLYVALLIWTKLSINKFSSPQVSINIRRHQLKWQLIITLLLSACAYFSTIFISFMSSVVINLAPANRLYVTVLSVTNNLINISGIFNAAILFLRLKDIQKYTKRLFHMQTNTVRKIIVLPINNNNSPPRGR